MFHYLQGGGGVPSTTTANDILGDYLKEVNSPLMDFLGGLKDFGKTIQNFDVEMGKVVRTMGIGVENSLQLKKNFNDAYNEVVDLGGTFKDVTEQQEAILDASGRNLILMKEQSKELYAATSITGIDAKKLVKSFYDAGMEQTHIAQTTVKIYDVANKMGVNAKVVSDTVTTNLDKLNRFGFVNGVEGLAKMAGKAQALRFDVKQTFELAESLMSPEKAIETAAAIQRLGGAATALTDPLKLMDLAQNNVEGLQDELGKLAKQYTFFDEKTQSFQIMKGARGQLKEVADALGIDRSEFEKLALSSANVAKKMSQIRFPGLDISDEDKEQLANLAQLKDVGGGRKEYFVNYTNKDGVLQSEKLSEIGAEQLALIKEQNKAKSGEETEDPQKRLVKIAEGQLTEFERLVIAQEKIQNVMTNTLASSKGGNEYLKGVRESFETTATGVSKAFGPGSDFEKNMNGAGADFTNVSKLLRNLVSGDFAQVASALQSLVGIAGQGAKDFAIEQVRAYTDSLAKLRVDKVTVSSAYTTLKTEAATAISNLMNDGYKAPRVGGDTLKTPTGDIILHEKDYFWASTKMPEVLQKSAETGMKNILKDKMLDISSIISSALSNNLNSNGGNSQPQKQEVTHTVNFKVSVDTPKNKLSDMLVDELTKSTTVMKYIVDNFEKTKTSGGMVVKK